MMVRRKSPSWPHCGCRRRVSVSPWQHRPRRGTGWFGYRHRRLVADPPTPSLDVLLPPGADLLVLNGTPLELAGRVAVEGELLFEDDAAARVQWLAQTRKIYFDEKPRIERSHREFAESLRRGR